jgi:hypothetical protein
MELFVESGSARVTDIRQAAGKSPAASDLKAGEYAAQSAERPLRFEQRAPPAFVATIPRYLLDPLPALAAKYKTVKLQLAADGQLTYAEAEPWLAGPHRKVFLKRFQPRLKDHEFRAGVEAHIARYPEWDRLLHPENYAPKASDKAK